MVETCGKSTEATEIFLLRSPIRAHRGRLRECRIWPGGWQERVFALFYFAVLAGWPCSSFAVQMAKSFHFWQSFSLHPRQCNCRKLFNSEKIWQGNDWQRNKKRPWHTHSSANHSSAISGAAQREDGRQKNGVIKIFRFLHF